MQGDDGRVLGGGPGAFDGSTLTLGGLLILNDCERIVVVQGEGEGLVRPEMKEKGHPSYCFPGKHAQIVPYAQRASAMARCTVGPLSGLN